MCAAVDLMRISAVVKPRNGSPMAINVVLVPFLLVFVVVVVVVVVVVRFAIR